VISKQAMSMVSLPVIYMWAAGGMGGTSGGRIVGRRVVVGLLRVCVRTRRWRTCCLSSLPLPLTRLPHRLPLLHPALPPYLPSPPLPSLACYPLLLLLRHHLPLYLLCHATCSASLRILVWSLFLPNCALLLLTLRSASAAYLPASPTCLLMPYPSPSRYPPAVYPVKTDGVAWRGCARAVRSPTAAYIINIKRAARNKHQRWAS